MISDCYEEAGEDVIMSDACDLFEKDLTKLLWNELNAYELMLYNKEKYTFTYEKMKEETFHKLVENLRVIYDELSDLIDEVDAHRDVMVVRIKGHVDDRTNHIVAEAKAFANSPEPKIQKYNIEVKETITDPMAKYSYNLPRPLRLDSKTSEAFHGENGYQEMANRIEEVGNSNLKKMYGSTQKNEVLYDPDHIDSENNLHSDHQTAVMKKIFQGSMLAGDPTQNPGVFLNHMTDMPSQEDLMQEYGKKKRKLSRFIPRRRVRRFRSTKLKNERLRI